MLRIAVISLPTNVGRVVALAKREGCCGTNKKCSSHIASQAYTNQLHIANWVCVCMCVVIVFILRSSCSMLLGAHTLIRLVCMNETLCGVDTHFPYRISLLWTLFVRTVVVVFAFIIFCVLTLLFLAICLCVHTHDFNAPVAHFASAL